MSISTRGSALLHKKKLRKKPRGLADLTKRKQLRGLAVADLTKRKQLRGLADLVSPFCQWSCLWIAGTCRHHYTNTPKRKGGTILRTGRKKKNKVVRSSGNRVRNYLEESGTRNRVLYTWSPVQGIGHDPTSKRLC